jgi:hypothetical protein
LDALPDLNQSGEGRVILRQEVESRNTAAREAHCLAGHFRLTSPPFELNAKRAKA